MSIFKEAGTATEPLPAEHLKAALKLNPLVTEEKIRNVLFWFGDREHGWEGGDFTKSLIKTITLADVGNQLLLGQNFAAEVIGVTFAKEYPNGMAAMALYVEEKKGDVL